MMGVEQRYFGVGKGLKTGKTGKKRDKSGKYWRQSEDFCGNRGFRLDFAHGKVAL